MKFSSLKTEELDKSYVILIIRRLLKNTMKLFQYFR